ncbi:predicted protein [Arabidopsis lyrata subsp. lyrata]|uniref:Predicted protein n=1 Tax=Arabidopsis lyrata subsp. lyrata TaxID=81972 RepID=D7MSW8_ARALL|nr:predicted protein [Arabidopsis lyrata subsp. lyrata]
MEKQLTRFSTKGFDLIQGLLIVYTKEPFPFPSPKSVAKSTVTSKELGFLKELESGIPRVLLQHNCDQTHTCHGG